jgi:hypothetical protein
MDCAERLCISKTPKVLNVDAVFRARWRLLKSAEQLAESDWGSGDPGFESRHPDHFSPRT